MEYDNFDPREENDLDDMKREGLNDFKKYDTGYYKLSRNIKVNNKLKRVNIDLYASSSHNNSSIRDAITGYYTKYKVGKVIDEDLFFKVSISTGEITKNNRMFFFHSPSEYEGHLNVTLSEDIKTKWKIKEEAALIRHKLEHYFNS